ncbi:calcium-transporting ATPase [Rhizoctonia solani]|uniref:Calcium-transporting ATPase n=1 Tax=Rhizoctonia solani TaxID=456999 RepID=A0A8H8SXR3_9AGAM|nr:calcium-transporting ATPase [Rhizoctonia solani]QRW20817.1 calcium-transporting ATPase [Rhizoctonia solani]
MPRLRLRVRSGTTYSNSISAPRPNLCSSSKLVDSSGSLPAPLVRSDMFNPQTDYLLTVKGAPDVLYPRCTSIMSPVDGQVFDLTPERLAQLTAVQNRWAARDHPATAVAIAAQAGIVSGNPDAIHRLSDLDDSLDEKAIPQYDPDAKDRSLFTSDSSTDPEKGSSLANSGMKNGTLCQYDEIVFARTSPEQKLRIVHEFQRRGGVVAMTGDGVNDAPSLKAADCGIAMGDGSDVAREAADMVLLENFEAIVVALEYGRLVYDNLKKTVLYLLPAGSFSELMPILLNILIGVPQMLSSLQMIIICVGTDVLPALSLALEKPEQGLLSRRPRNVKTDRLADWKLLLHAYGFIGVLESLCAMSMSFWYLQRNGVPFSDLVLGFGNWPTLDEEKLDKAQSVYFFTLVIMQWGNLLATRSRKLSIFQHKPSGNWYIFPAMICALVIGIFFSYVPFFQKTFLTRGVPVEHYFLPVAFGLGILLLDEARKFMIMHTSVNSSSCDNCSDIGNPVTSGITGSIKPSTANSRQQYVIYRPNLDWMAKARMGKGLPLGGTRATLRNRPTRVRMLNKKWTDWARYRPRPAALCNEPVYSQPCETFMARSSSQHQHTALDVPGDLRWPPHRGPRLGVLLKASPSYTLSTARTTVQSSLIQRATRQDALTAAVQRFSQYFASATPSRQVWLAKGLRTRRNRWIWAEIDPESFLNAIQDNAVEIRLCDNEQDGYDSDESDCLSVIMSEEESVQTNMTSLLQTDDGFKSSQSSMSNLSCLQTQTPSPAAIAQSLIDEAVHIYHSTTDYPTAISKLEHAASVIPPGHPDLKAQCYLHLGQLAQASYNFPSAEMDALPAQTQAQIKANRRLSTISTLGGLSPASTSLSTARSHFRHAHKLFTESKNRAGQLRCKQAVASIALDEQDWDSARSQILYILDAGKREGVEIDEVWCWSALALVSLRQGEPEEVDNYWNKAWRAGAR